MIVDGQLFIRTGEMALTLDPPTTQQSGECGTVIAPPSSIITNSVENKATLTYAAYHILTAADPMEKVTPKRFVSY